MRLRSCTEAESISIGYAPDSGPASDVPNDTHTLVSDVLMPYFGVGDDVRARICGRPRPPAVAMLDVQRVNPQGKADALMALLSREGVDPASFDAAHLSKYITRRQCRYRPLCRGQRFSVPVPVQDNAGAGGAADGTDTAANDGDTGPSTGAAAVRTSGAAAVAGAGGAGAGSGTAAVTGGTSPSRQSEAWYNGVGSSGWYHFVVHEVAPRDAAHGVVTVGPSTKLAWVSDRER